MQVFSPVLTTFDKFFAYENPPRSFVVISNTSLWYKTIEVERLSRDEVVVVEDDTLFCGNQMTSMVRVLDGADRPYGG